MEVRTSKRIGKKEVSLTKIADVLKSNLFTLAENDWVYTDDNKQPAMKATYRVEGDEVVFDVWMTDSDMYILFDKIISEIKGEI